jgi:hypothetical protein
LPSELAPRIPLACFFCRSSGRSRHGSMAVSKLVLVAGLAATIVFVASYLPMLFRALRTRDLGSYSRSSLVLANIGNVIQAVYVYNLPAGPIWFLHGFYVAASAVMLALHLTQKQPQPTRPNPTTEASWSH